MSSSTVASLSSKAVTLRFRVSSITLNGGNSRNSGSWEDPQDQSADAFWSTDNGSPQLDGANIGGQGGSALTIGGTLTNSSGNDGIAIGNTGITSADTVTVKGTGGIINSGAILLEGNVTTQATLDVANAAAGFGTKGMETGTVFLENDALLEFKSGQITTIGGTLQLDGALSRIADAGAH